MNPNTSINFEVNLIPNFLIRWCLLQNCRIRRHKFQKILQSFNFIYFKYGINKVTITGFISGLVEINISCLLWKTSMRVLLVAASRFWSNSLSDNLRGILNFREDWCRNLRACLSCNCISLIPHIILAYKEGERSVPILILSIYLITCHKMFKR